MQEIIVHLIAALHLGLPATLFMLPLLPILGMAQNQQPQFGIRESTSLVYSLVHAYATAVTPFIRKGFGKEALGWPGLLAFLLILCVAGFNGSQTMLMYLCGWLAAVACQRVYTFRLLWRGVKLHSRYQGWPSFATAFTGGNWKAAVFVIEPLICLGLGLVCRDQDEIVLGNFLVGAAASLFLREVFEAQINAQRLTVLRDAQIDQQYLLEEYRRQGY